MGGMPLGWTTSVEALPQEAAWGQQDGPCGVLLTAVPRPPASASPETLVNDVDLQTGNGVLGICILWSSCDGQPYLNTTAPEVNLPDGTVFKSPAQRWRKWDQGLTVQHSS